MPWLDLLALPLTVPATGLDPLAGAQSAILGYGPIGIAVLALGWLMFRGWRLTSPAREADIRESGRHDLLREIDRLQAEADRIRGERDRNAEQRDEALRIARDQLAPLLYQFTAATGSLLPVLQHLASQPPGLPPAQPGGIPQRQGDLPWASGTARDDGRR